MRKAIIFIGLLIVLSSFAYADLSDYVDYYKLDDAGTVMSNTGGSDYGLDYNGALQHSYTNVPGSTYSLGFDGVDDVALNSTAKMGALFTSLNQTGFTVLWRLNTSSYAHGGYSDAVMGFFDYANDGGWVVFFNTDAQNGLIRVYMPNNGVNLQSLRIPLNYWNCYGFRANTTKFTLFVDGKENTSANYAAIDYKSSDFRLGFAKGWSTYFDGSIDEVVIYNRSLTASEINDFCTNGMGEGDVTPPIISNLTCISCDVPNGDTVQPFETEDTTPTFNFTTDDNAWCVIGLNDTDYTTMNTTNNGTCTTGEGEKSHICTLPVKDKFANVGTNYLYISCKNSDGYEGNASDPSKSNSGPIWMEIQGAGETTGDDAIELGITSSVIGATATIYSSQQIYARNLANSQFAGAFDKVAVNGNKRWAFNYVSAGESQITGLFNLTPVLYVLQMQNLTNETIIDEVGKLINNTY